MSQVIAFVGDVTPAETETWLAALSAALPSVTMRALSELSEAERLACELAVVANPDPDALTLLPKLRWVHSVWAGVERLVSRVPEHIQIVRLEDPHLAQTMAEAVLAWTFYLHRDMPLYRMYQQQRLWKQRAYIAASERRIGILGLGKLGDCAAQRLVAQGFQVSGWSRQIKQIEGVRSYVGERGFTSLLSSSDILINLLPLTRETKGLLSSAEFQLLPKGASLINFGRGATVDLSALVIALERGQLTHAVLDVFTEEPLASSSGLWTHPQITILPHISAPTSVHSASQIVAKNIAHFLQTGEMPNTIDRLQGY